MVSFCQQPKLHPAAGGEAAVEGNPPGCPSSVIVKLMNIFALSVLPDSLPDRLTPVFRPTYPGAGTLYIGISSGSPSTV